MAKRKPKNNFNSLQRRYIGSTKYIYFGKVKKIIELFILWQSLRKT